MISGVKKFEHKTEWPKRIRRCRLRLLLRRDGIEKALVKPRPIPRYDLLLGRAQPHHHDAATAVDLFKNISSETKAAAASG